MLSGVQLLIFAVVYAVWALMEESSDVNILLANSQKRQAGTHACMTRYITFIATSLRGGSHFSTFSQAYKAYTGGRG
jgi:hypothetical protein